MRHLRRVAALLVLALLAALVWVLVARRTAPTPAPGAGPLARGRLVVALRAEPRSFNRLVARDRGSLLISQLIHAKLVQLNHATQDIEPALAESWTLSPDGRTVTLALRRDVAFSDGAPFTADDVAFSFAAIYEPTSASPLADTFSVGGKRFDVRAADPHTVVITLPAPHAPAVRSLNSLPILPAHKLRAALEAKKLREAWTTATPPQELAGLGPFVVESYTPGQRLDLVRNPRYWRGGGDGPDARPHLERLTFRVLPDQQAELLALEAGEIDLMHAEVRPEDVAAVRRLAQAGRAQVVDLGVSLDADSLWFNLGPAADTRPDAARPWLDARFRRAVSLAVNRRQFVDAVMLGAGEPLDGPISPGNRAWRNTALPAAAYDVGAARTLLAETGLSDRDGDGLLELAGGAPLRLELLTQRGHAMRERAASVLKADLRVVGLDVSVSTLDPAALGERLTTGKFDATYFGFSISDPDPSLNLDYWLSGGSFHVWHPQQKAPATPWEREIDTLMHEMTAETDPAARKARFDRVQQIFVEQAPAIYFAAPTFTLAMSPRVRGAEPGRLFPFVLWRADSLEAAAR